MKTNKYKRFLIGILVVGIITIPIIYYINYTQTQKEITPNQQDSTDKEREVDNTQQEKKQSQKNPWLHIKSYFLS